MSTIVIMPGGFHPFHAGHMALYNSVRNAFPDADLYVAATNSQETRPFPFAVKEKLAKVAGVAPGHFVQVKSPFQAKEITQNYDPEHDVLIFVRSEKDRNESPKPGGMKKDGTPAYFQLYTGKNLQPFAKHAYFAYLPTVEFGPGITSATEIRKAWPTLDDRRKTAMVMSLYPATQKNPKLANVVMRMLDQVMGGQVAEAINDADRVSKGKPTSDNVRRKYWDKTVGTILGGKSSDSEKKKAWDRYQKIGKVTDPELFKEQGVAEGAPIVVALAPIDVRNPKKAQQPQRFMGDIVPPTTPPSTEKRGVKGRPGQRPMPKYEEGVAEGSDSGWIGNPAKWKEAVLQAYGPDVVFKNYTHPGQPGKRSVNAINAQGKQVGVYQRHNKMGMVQPNQQGVEESFGLPLPGTYEQEHDMNQKQSGQHTHNLTTEEVEADPEIAKTMAFAKQHYPSNATKQEAFTKFVIHALRHSEQDDRNQDEEITDLQHQIDLLKAKINVTESADYIDEK